MQKTIEVGRRERRPVNRDLIQNDEHTWMVARSVLKGCAAKLTILG